MKPTRTRYHFLDLSTGRKLPKTWEEMLSILMVLVSRRGAKVGGRLVGISLGQDVSSANLLSVDDAVKLATKVPPSNVERLLERMRLDKEAAAEAKKRREDNAIWYAPAEVESEEEEGSEILYDDGLGGYRNAAGEEMPRSPSELLLERLRLDEEAQAEGNGST
jgi:hypothetical protein